MYLDLPGEPSHRHERREPNLLDITFCGSICIATYDQAA